MISYYYIFFYRILDIKKFRLNINLSHNNAFLMTKFSADVSTVRDSEIHGEAKHYYIDFRQKIKCLIYDINASIRAVRDQ